MNTGLAASLARLDADGASAACQAAFADAYRRCLAGESGLIREDTIRPLLEPARLDDVEVTQEQQRAAIQRTAVIRLNGGLGTSMGLDAAKTLLPIREGRTFLDLILDQVEHVRAAWQADLPLIFLNSFRTSVDTRARLAERGVTSLPGIPMELLQNRQPKLRADTMEPVDWPADSELEWCPPGHGDLYPVLWSSGILDVLLERGLEILSVANGDNLGAGPDPRIAGWFAASGAPYAAEVCTRTPNDRKGGHLAIRRSDGRLILRDTAQTAAEEMRFFTDEATHPYFHANNLWFDLARLREVLAAHDGVLGLPLIRNAKTVDPADAGSTPVIQLESAMGAAIEKFDGAVAIAVGRDRFLPVKTTNELLLLRSDVFSFGEDARPVAVAEIPQIDLDSRFYRLIGDFDERFAVAPSLRRATSLTVRGDWRFEEPSDVVGALELPDIGFPGRYP